MFWLSESTIKSFKKEIKMAVKLENNQTPRTKEKGSLSND